MAAPNEPTLRRRGAPSPRRAGGPTSLSAVAAACGLRRAEVVRVIVRPTGTSAEVTGVVHRYPRTVAIPLGTARGLVAAGVPLRIDRREAPGPPC